MLVLIGILAFASVSLGAWEALRPKENVVRRRILPEETIVARRDRQLEGSIIKRMVRPAAIRMGHTFGLLLPQNVVRGVDRMLVMANEPWSLSGFLATWLVSIVVGFLFLAYVALARPGITATQMIGLGVLILPMAVLLPYALLRHRVQVRQRSIVRALPDALDLLVTSVEAGLGVDAAFAMVTEKTSGPLSETFALYLKHVGLGRPRREALAHVAERTGVADLMGVAASVTQGEELGTTLGDVLRTQAEGLRLLRRQRAQEAAQRAPVLMTIPLALCFLPAMGAVVIVPSILNLANFVGNLGGK